VDKRATFLRDHMKNIETESEKMAPIVKHLMENLNRPVYLELMLAVALERMVKYRAHIKAGFTEDQALELCKA
jgi:methyltransferase-like protein